MLINITIPVYNEEKILKQNMDILYNFLKQNLKCDWEIVIADNGSFDQTQKIGQSLALTYPKIKYFRIEKRGRGRALKYVWRKSKADILSYMDVDLATDLNCLPQLIRAIQKETDIAIGSRYLPEAKIQRSTSRKILSRWYNRLLGFFLRAKFTDGQCGFKAISRKVLKNIIPQVKDNHWFFDTEMLVLAERTGYNIKEIPVKWIETRNKYRKSKVKIIPAVLGNLFSILKLKLRLWRE